MSIKTRIIIFCVLFFIWSQTQNVITPPNVVHDLSAQELEAKVVAGVLVISDEAKKAQPATVPEVQTPIAGPEEVIKPNPTLLTLGRHPRAVVLTDLRSCQPCKTFDRNVVNQLRKSNYQKMGWTVGTDFNNMVEIVDMNQNREKFDQYFELIEDDRPSTPTIVLIGEDGTVVDTHKGSMSLNDFIKFAKQSKPKPKEEKVVMSHQEMIQLHNELHGDSTKNWTWPGDLATHLRTDHGVDL